MNRARKTSIPCQLPALILIVTLISPSFTLAAPRTRTFEAADTFNNPRDDNPLAQQALDAIKWKPGKFEVICETPASPEEGELDRMYSDYDALVRFPSALGEGDAVKDTVVMEWYAPRDSDGKVIKGPAMVVLHILDGRMLIARGFARTFRENGIHAFVMHMPHYGRRSDRGRRPNATVLVEGTRQAVADARRAKDAIAALPNVDAARIGIQGTSLGGFICVGAASLDDAFNPVFPTLAGGDLVSMFKNGKHEVERIKESAERMGITLEQLQKMLEALEPNLLVHRIDAKHLWMFNATDDEVIPADNAEALAKAAKLPQKQHIWMAGGHVTCIVELPKILPVMVEQIKATR
ncbi:MAG: acetylxylan esterase [Phycisphaeraceae bacterium]